MTAGQRYGTVATALHWAMAAALLANLGLGWWMHEALEATASRAGAVAGFQVHKSLGLTLLVLAVARLLLRLAHRAPPLPATMPQWQRLSARSVHAAVFAL